MRFTGPIIRMVAAFVLVISACVPWSVIANSSVSAAAVCGPGVGGDLTHHTFGAWGKQRCSGGHSGSPSGQPVQASTPNVVTETTWVLDCSINDGDSADGGTSCQGASATCPPGELRYKGYQRQITRKPPSVGRWLAYGASKCSATRPAGTNNGPNLPELVAAAYQRVPVVASSLHIQPPAGKTLVNLATNFYVTGAPQTFPMTLLGQRIVLTATPTSYTFTCGDGHSVGPTDQAGGPYPALTNTCTYRSTGTVRPTVSTVFAGTWTLNGGAPQQIQGTVTRTSAPQNLIVLQARSQLIENP